MQAAKTLVRSFYTGLPMHFGRGWAAPPLMVALTVTYKCNLKCVMCLQRVEDRKAREEGLQELDGEEIKRIIRQTIPRVANIGFCGGEIFMRKDIMDLLHFAAARNRISFVSNGTLFSPEIARELVGMGVEFMLFSVDGPPQMHDQIRGRAGTFAKVMEAIEYVQRAKRDLGASRPVVHANCVVMRENAESLHVLVDELAATGIGHLGLQLEDHCLHRWSTSLASMGQLFEPPDLEAVASIGNIREIIEDVIRYGAERRVRVYLKPDCTVGEFCDYYDGGMDVSDYECSLPWRQIFISPHGEVYPCFMLRLGNVRESGLLEVWNSDGYKKFRRALRKNGLFPQCYGCCFLQRRKRGLHQ